MASRASSEVANDNDDDDLPSVTAEDIRTAMEEAYDQMEKDREEARRKRDNPVEERTGVCVVCNGKVVGRITREYVGDPMIIGPGGRDQMRNIHHGWHCTKCGLKYEFPTPVAHHPV